MKTLFWTTNFNGNEQIHCQLVIEEITIIESSDKRLAEELTEVNDHNGVRKIALKYTQNELFKQAVTRIDELEDTDLNSETVVEHQVLVRFLLEHFRVLF